MTNNHRAPSAGASKTGAEVIDLAARRLRAAAAMQPVATPPKADPSSAWYHAEAVATDGNGAPHAA